jgi:GT2 family glycosyltransferase
LESKSCTVAILNYNGLHWLQKFLPTVVDCSPEAVLFVYDNASTDGSVAYLKEYHPSIKLVVGSQNLGFCGGYNRAFEHIDTPYTVLLNSDVGVTPNWLRPLLAQVDGDASVAAVQPKVRSYHQKTHFEYAGAAGGFMDKYGYPFCRGRLFDTLEEDLGQYDSPMDIFWATGACMLIRTEVYRELGGLNEDFFAHMEEIDLCWRIHRAGYRVCVDPASVVYHVGGGTLGYDSPKKLLLNYRNNLLMLSNNLRGFYRYRILLIRMVLDGISAFYGLAKGQWGLPITILKAHFQFYSILPKQNRHRLPFDVRPKTASVVFQYFALGRKRFSQLSLQVPNQTTPSSKMPLHVMQKAKAE